MKQAHYGDSLFNTRIIADYKVTLSVTGDSADISRGTTQGAKHFGTTSVLLEDQFTGAWRIFGHRYFVALVISKAFD